MTLREVIGMGRHSCEQSGRPLCRYRCPWMWRGGRTRCCQEMTEIRRHPFSISNRHGDLGLNKRLCIPFLWRPCLQVQWSVWWQPRRVVHFQRLSITIHRSIMRPCSTSHPPAPPWRRRDEPHLTAIPHLRLIIFFVVNPWTYTTRGT